jgi:hypothetical protein
MNVKPGDIAIIITAHPAHSDCIGLIVNVIGWDAGNRIWTVEFAGAAPASVLPFDRCGAADHILRPVSGLDDPDQIDTEQPINNEVTA